MRHSATREYCEEGNDPSFISLLFLAWRRARRHIRERSRSPLPRRSGRVRDERRADRRRSVSARRGRGCPGDCNDEPHRRIVILGRGSPFSLSPSPPALPANSLAPLADSNSATKAANPEGPEETSSESKAESLDLDLYGDDEEDTWPAAMLSCQRDAIRPALDLMEEMIPPESRVVRPLWAQFRAAMEKVLV